MAFSAAATIATTFPATLCLSMYNHGPVYACPPRGRACQSLDFCRVGIGGTCHQMSASEAAFLALPKIGLLKSSSQRVHRYHNTCMRALVQCQSHTFSCHLMTGACVARFVFRLMLSLCPLRPLDGQKAAHDTSCTRLPFLLRDAGG